MKNKRNRKTDYQSSLFIGGIMLFVSIGGLIAYASHPIVNTLNILGTIFLFIQAFVRYKKKQNWVSARL